MDQARADALAYIAEGIRDEPPFSGYARNALSPETCVRCKRVIERGAPALIRNNEMAHRECGTVLQARPLADPADPGAEPPDAPPPPKAKPKNGASTASRKVTAPSRPITQRHAPSLVLEGLEHLGPLAVVGRDRILELAATRTPYVWQDIAIAGTIVLIAGAPGDGKTTLLFVVLAARLNLGPAVHLLDRRIEPAPAGRYIIIIEGEHSESSAARKLLRSVRLLGVDESSLERAILVARKAVRLGSPQWADVVRLVERGLVSDIAIDTVARVAPANADSEVEQVAIFEAVAQAIEKAPGGSEDKPLVWAVAHTRKNNVTGDVGDVSGSAQRTGQADTVLLLRGEKVDGRTVATRVTFAKLREEPDPGVDSDALVG